MTHLLLQCIILTSFRLTSSIILHAKGPTHRKLAESCLEDIVRRNFHLPNGKSNVNHTMLLTMMVTNNMTSPAFEIQEDILIRIHELAKSYQIEILSDGRRFGFESYAECLEDECQKTFIVDFKTNFYVIVVDNVKLLDILLDEVEDSVTFNPRASFLVYFEYEGPKYKEMAKEILMRMRQKLLVRSAVLIPKTLQIFNLYRLNTATRGPYECETNITLSEIDQCVKGRMQNKTENYYKLDDGRDFLNCTVGVIAMPIMPFVINDTFGFEIEVLHSIANIINVHLNITVSENGTDTWGAENSDGTWTGKLKYVYQDYYLGVGNVETGMSYAVDFTFSTFYHMEPLVFVVPIARFIPKWRILIAIFKVEVWGIYIGVTICFGIIFYITSKFGREIENFTNVSNCLYQSIQIVVWHAVPKQPATDLTRVFFLSLTVISIMITSAYTCSLIYYLQNPIREHQASVNSDIKDEFGNYIYGIGGISRYRELFSSGDDKGSGLFEMYQTSSGENDTVLYWINKVAEDRNIWTISSKLFANYLLAQNSNVTVDNDGAPKIYVFNNQLVSYSISLIMRKGHPLLRNINHAIQRLMWGGIIAHISLKYTEAIKRKMSIIEDVDDTYSPLGIENFQGVFALLLLGSGLGLVTLISECFVKKFREKRSRKLKRKHITRTKRVVKKVPGEL